MTRLLPLLLTGCFGALTGPSAAPPDEELLSNVEQLREAQQALLVVDDFVPCGSEAQARSQMSAQPRMWEGDACWTRIGWEPDGPVRGGYWVEVNSDGEDFTVHGLATGPAGELHVTATRHQPAKALGSDS